jgi:hypothetical protein
MDWQIMTKEGIRMDKLNRQFRVTLPIMRSYAEGSLLFLEGAASDASYDNGNPRGRMTSQAIFGFVDCVKDGIPAAVFNELDINLGQISPSVALDSESPYHVAIDNEHSEDWQDQMGYAVEARVIDGDDVPQAWLESGIVPPVFWVKLAIDTNLAHGYDLGYKLGALPGRDGSYIAKPAKLGLSIAGQVLQAHDEMHDNGQYFRVFDLVLLQKIAVTKQPANKNTWLEKIAKSVQPKVGELMLTRTTKLDNEDEQADTTDGNVPASEEPVTTEASDATDEPQADTDAHVAQDETPDTEPVEAEAVEADADTDAPVQDEAQVDEGEEGDAQGADEATEDEAEADALQDSEDTEPEAEDAQAVEDTTEVEGEAAEVAASEEVTEPEADAEETDTAETVEPDEADADTTEEDDEDTTGPVQLSLTRLESVETVLRAQIESVNAENKVIRNELVELKTLMSEVPSFIEAQNAAIARLQEALEEKGLELTQAREDLQATQERLTALEALPLGKKGMIARSTLIEQNPEYANLSKGERRARIQQLRAEGKHDEAWALALI